MTGMYHRNAMIAVILILTLAVHHTAGQLLYNPNDERFKSLYLEKVQNDYKVQKDEFDRQNLLHTKGLISEKEFRESENRFKSAQITYQQAILSLAFEQPHITIDAGIKYQGRDGKKKVRLTLRNSTGGLIEGKNIQLDEFEGIHTDRISNVYVSLLNDQHAIISRPYEAKIVAMPYNRPITVDFLLLQDLDNVTIKCVYGDKSEEKKILLQKDESANRVLMTSEQFSQEADLGARASYDLTLELFSSTENVYRLVALNLPRQVAYDFLEAQTNARLSQVKFSQDVNTRKLSLAVYLPDRYDSSSFPIDRPLSFFAAVVPRELTDKVLEERHDYTSEELDRMGLSYARLELLPRGVGRIQVQAANFYHEIRPAEAVQMVLTVLNDGTRRLDNVKIRADAPLNWVAAVSPDLITALDPGKEERVQVTIRPPADAGVGDYEATIKTESYADNRKVESEDKKIRIHLAAGVNFWGTGALVVLLGGILAGIVVFGVRLSRK